MPDLVSIGRDAVDDHVEFIVTPTSARIGALLATQGHCLIPGVRARGDSFVSAYSATAPHLDRAFENLKKHAQEVIRQLLGDAPVIWEDALDAALDLIEPTRADWCLVGGTALAVQDVDVMPADVDFVTDRRGAFELGEAFADYLLAPVIDIPSFGTFGRAFIHARIEWLGNPNEIDRPASEHQWHSVEWRGRTFCASPLDEYLQIEQNRGRRDRVRAIQRRIDRSGRSSPRTL